MFKQTLFALVYMVIGISLPCWASSDFFSIPQLCLFSNFHDNGRVATLPFKRDYTVIVWNPEYRDPQPDMILPIEQSLESLDNPKRLILHGKVLGEYTGDGKILVYRFPEYNHIEMFTNTYRKGGLLDVSLLEPAFPPIKINTSKGETVFTWTTPPFDHRESWNYRTTVSFNTADSTVKLEAADWSSSGRGTNSFRLQCYPREQKWRQVIEEDGKNVSTSPIPF